MNSPSALTAVDLQKVQQAAAKVAQTCSARIVPVVVKCSGEYERGEELLGFWAAALALALMLILFCAWPMTASASAGANQPVWKSGLTILLTIVAAGFLVGTLLSYRMGWLGRLFVSRRAMKRGVHERAKAEFFDRCQAQGAENSSAAVLIYVSVAERMAEVIFDDRLRDRVTLAVVHGIRKDITRHVRSHQTATGVCRAMETLAAAIGACDGEQSRGQACAVVSST